MPIASSQPAVRNQRLHDALHIHNHGFNGTGHDREFLMQEVACRRDALAHESLVGSTADTRKLDAICACGFGVFNDLRVLRHSHEHFA